MHTLKLAIAITWGVFWAYWLVSAVAAKEGAGGRRRLPASGLTVVAVLLVVRVIRDGSLAVESPVVAAIGAVLFASGIVLAVWARLELGRNWGMPMTEKAEPELVTAGPYRLVRHPIYSGLLLAVLGTAPRDQPDRPAHCGGPGRLLLLLRVRRGAQPHGDLPRELPGLPHEHEDAHSLLPLGGRRAPAVTQRT